MKRRRSQSQDSPSRFCCSMIVLPDVAFHCQTRSMNRSRPSAFPREAFAQQLFFDDVLGRDAGMVGSRQPEGIASLHASPADQDVLQRMIQCVADMRVSR